LPVVLQRVNFDMVSMLWFGVPLKGSGCEKHYINGKIQYMENNGIDKMIEYEEC